MQVSLKQSELVVAVRNYLTTAGINLAGKDVEVAFSATRGEAGILATISIEDADLPDLTPNVAPKLHVVNQLVNVATHPLMAAAEPSPFVADEPVLAAAEVEEPKTGKSSLFS